MKETVKKLEGALQEKKEAEVALRVRAASAEGCLRVTTANSQARIKEVRDRMLCAGPFHAMAYRARG